MRLTLTTLALTLLIASPAAAKFKVVATLTPLAALATAIGGDLVQVTALASPNQDPHYVDARPSFLVPLSRADLLVVNGLELEIGWLPPLIDNARNPAIRPGAAGYLDASTVVRRLGVPTGEVTRDQGDLHPGGNPHFLCDPRAGSRIAVALGQRLAALDPDHAADYLARAAAEARKLDALAAREHQRFAALPAEARRVVAYHASMIYLADWLGLEQVAFVEPKPGIPPSPGHVAQVLSLMRSTGARVILQERHYPANTSQQLAGLAKATLLRLDTGPDVAQGQSYEAWTTSIAEAIHDAMLR